PDLLHVRASRLVRPLYAIREIVLVPEQHVLTGEAAQVEKEGACLRGGAAIQGAGGSRGDRSSRLAGQPCVTPRREHRSEDDPRLRLTASIGLAVNSPGFVATTDSPPTRAEGSVAASGMPGAGGKSPDRRRPG